MFSSAALFCWHCFAGIVLSEFPQFFDRLNENTPLPALSLIQNAAFS
jgi:hypothetical protein